MNSGQKPVSSKTWRLIFWGSSLPALLAASFLYFPRATTGPVLCPMALILGLPCPGCGITRAFCFASHGHFAEAFRFHPLWPLILAYLTFLWGYQMVEVARGEPPKLPTYRIAGTALTVLLGFWAVRLVWFFTHGGLQTMAHDNVISRLIRLFGAL
jgi:hypothetical protein